MSRQYVTIGGYFVFGHSDLIMAHWWLGLVAGLGEDLYTYFFLKILYIRIIHCMNSTEPP